MLTPAEVQDSRVTAGAQQSMGSSRKRLSDARILQVGKINAKTSQGLQVVKLYSVLGVPCKGVLSRPNGTLL